MTADPWTKARARLGLTESRAWSMPHELFGALPVQHRHRAKRPTSGFGPTLDAVRRNWDVLTLSPSRGRLRVLHVLGRERRAGLLRASP